MTSGNHPVSFGIVTMTNEIYDHLKESASLKIEFTDNADSYYRLSTTIKRVHDDYIVVNPPETGGILYEIRQGTLINLIFNRKNGVLIAQCEFLGPDEKDPESIKIGFPGEVKILERREYVRVPLKVRAEVSYYSENSIEKETFFVSTRNISGSGICFLHDKSLEGCENINCKIFLNDEISTPVKVQCKHVYSRAAKIRYNIFFLIALSYTYISENDLSRIMKECFKYQINCKHMEKY